MKEFPKKISADNFDEAVDYVSKAKAIATRKNLIKKITRPIGNIVFALLSFLLSFGLVFKLSTAEEAIVFEKLGFLRDFWIKYSDLFTNDSMNTYVYWVILIVSAFLIPLIITALVTLIVTLSVKSDSLDFSTGTMAERAKNLYYTAYDIYSKTSNYDSGAMKNLGKLLFVLLNGGVLVYAFILLGFKFSVGFIIGFAICFVVLYLLFGLIISLFNLLNSLFYKIPSFYRSTTVTEEFWLESDPEERKRREEEEERKRREAEAARLAKERNKEIAAEKRIRALEYERNGQYSLAKQLFKEAAEMGDALGMDNYARHCLINGNRSEAIRWLQNAVDTGETDYETITLLRALKDGQNINAHYNN